MEWDWQVIPCDKGGATGGCVQVEASVVEPTTGIHETVLWGLDASSAALNSTVTLRNPSDNQTANFAHWINSPWVPGGLNELTDNTEFFIPTDLINVSSRWQQNLGPSPQVWRQSPLRFLRNWKGMGDIMAENMTLPFSCPPANGSGPGGGGATWSDGNSFYGVYSHDNVVLFLLCPV